MIEEQVESVFLCALPVLQEDLYTAGGQAGRELRWLCAAARGLGPLLPSSLQEWGETVTPADSDAPTLT